MALKTMDPDAIRAILEQHEDILTPLAKAEEEVFNNAICPSCYEKECYKKIDPPKTIVTEDGVSVISTPFSSRSPLPKAYAVCKSCGTKFDPRTGIIYREGESIIRDPHSDPH